MIKYFILIAVLVLTSPAFSKGSVEGLLGINFADKLDLEGSSDISSEDSLVMGGQYSAALKNGFGYNIGFTLDSVRDIGSGGRLGFLTFFGNMTYDFNESLHNMYVFLGLNLPLLVYEDKGMGDVDPVPGVQFGTGYYVMPRLSLELLFRTINFEIQNKDAKLWGFGFQVAYKFASF